LSVSCDIVHSCSGCGSFGAIPSFASALSTNDTGRAGTHAVLENAGLFSVTPARHSADEVLCGLSARNSGGDGRKPRKDVCMHG
jgi:hypothetical protein